MKRFCFVISPFVEEINLHQHSMCHILSVCVCVSGFVLCFYACQVKLTVSTKHLNEETRKQQSNKAVYSVGSCSGHRRSRSQTPVTNCFLLPAADPGPQDLLLLYMPACLTMLWLCVWVCFCDRRISNTAYRWQWEKPPSLLLPHAGPQHGTRTSQHPLVSPILASGGSRC